MEETKRQYLLSLSEAISEYAETCSDDSEERLGEILQKGKDIFFDFPIDDLTLAQLQHYCMEYLDAVENDCKK